MATKKKVVKSHSLKITNTFTDDHLPCVEFTLDGKNIDIWWTDDRLVGKLALVEEGMISLEKAMKNYPQTLKAILTGENPEEEEDKSVWYTDSGCLMIYKNVRTKRRW